MPPKNSTDALAVAPGEAVEDRFECLESGKENRPSNAAALDTLEAELFASVCYREVDETVAVNPNGAPAPAFFFR